MFVEVRIGKTSGKLLHMFHIRKKNLVYELFLLLPERVKDSKRRDPWLQVAHRQDETVRPGRSLSVANTPSQVSS